MDKTRCVFFPRRLCLTSSAPRSASPSACSTSRCSISQSASSASMRWCATRVVMAISAIDGESIAKTSESLHRFRTVATRLNCTTHSGIHCQHVSCTSLLLSLNRTCISHSGCLLNVTGPLVAEVASAAGSRDAAPALTRPHSSHFADIWHCFLASPLRYAGTFVGTTHTRRVATAYVRVPKVLGERNRTCRPRYILFEQPNTSMNRCHLYAD